MTRELEASTSNGLGPQEGRDVSTETDLAQRTVCLLRRLVSLAALCFLAATWRLWPPQTSFPQVPFLRAAGGLAAWTEWAGLTALAASLAVSFLGGGMIPIALFPNVLKSVLEYLPFSSLVSFPVLTFLGSYSFNAWIVELAVCIFWAAIFSLAALLIWNKGSREYSGVGI